MQRLIRTILLSFLGLSLLVFAGSRRHLVAATAVSATGAAQINGAIQLDVAISPPVVQPGDTLQLNVSLTNLGQSTYLPEITFRLPAGVKLDTMQLPQGMTINLAVNEMAWLPVVGANGGQQQFSLPLRVETADIGNPQQSVTAVMRLDDVEYSAAADFWLGIPPRVELINAPSQIAVGQAVQLRVETGGSAPISQSWELGDGRQVDVSNPTVVYPMAGLYQVRVHLLNPLAAVSGQQTITVVPHPAAQFAATDFSVAPNQSISFVNQSGGQPPLFFQWDFGDGNTDDVLNPVHHYAAPGVYDVRLVVENDYGRSEAIWPVTVGQPPMADMIVPESVPAGQPFSAQALGDETITRFSWNMGDGRFLEGTQINHTYSQTGDFYIILTANNEFGSTDIGRWIRIDSGFFTTYLPIIWQALTGRPVTGGVQFEENGLGIQLPDVSLTEPFVMKPLDLPLNLTQAEQLFIYINEARGHFNLPPLNMIPTLNTAAQQHTGDMSLFAYTAHTGSDGSTPAERLLQYQYPAGYAGEATAWGFEFPYQAVEFWVNSPAHRRIILNELATDVGVGYTVNYGAPNVWYWTAEFGNQVGAATVPQLRSRTPLPEITVLNTDALKFAWNWPLPLNEGQSFAVTLVTPDGGIPIGQVAEPRWGTYYLLETDLSAYPDAIGPLTWQVNLVQGEATQLSGEQRPLIVVPDPTLPTPTPVPLTPEPPTPTAIPTVTPTPENTARPSPTRPSNPPLPPPLVTATPQS